MTYVYQPFPAFRYGPNGASVIVQNENETPEGWVDHPSKVGQPVAAPKPAPAPAPEPIPAPAAAPAAVVVTPAPAPAKAPKAPRAPSKKETAALVKAAEEAAAKAHARAGMVAALNKAGFDVPEDSTDEEIKEEFDKLPSE